MQNSKAEKGLKSTLIGIFINLLLALTKGFAGVLGNSYALVADAIESLSDVVSSIVVYIGLKYSTKPKDENHPYGHGKAEPIAAIIVTLALLAAAVVIIVQSLSNISTPHQTPKTFTLIVLVIVVITKELMFRYVDQVGHEVQSTAVKTDAWHHRSDAITSAAAFIGILIAIIGGKGWEVADDWAALVASFVIIINAILLFTKAFNEIMDVKPIGNIHNDVYILANSVEGVVNTEKCIARKMGLDFIIELHVRVDGNETVSEGHRIAHLVKDKLISSSLNITDAIIHVEPS